MEYDKYFAELPSEEAVAVLSQKAKNWFNVLQMNNYLEKIERCWMFYHGVYHSDQSAGHQIVFSGEQGELVKLPVNHFRNLADHIINMVTANRPSFQARAINTDHKSLIQTKLANGLLDYYMREKRMESFLKMAVTYAVVLGSGYIKMGWNSTSGEVYDYIEETKTPIYAGDVEFSNLSPYDVVFDTTKEDPHFDWIIVRTFKNKYALAAKFPEKKDEILGLKTKSRLSNYHLMMSNADETMDVPVYEFFHKRDEALPDGRYMLYCDDNIVLMDNPLPYRDIPIFRITPSTILGTPFGYTNMFDIIPLQEAVNSLYSAILTNQNAFNVQNLWVPRGCDIDVNNLTGGLNIIEGNAQAGKPEPMNLLASSPETYNFLGLLEKTMETISAVNSVARGNAESGIKSGNALALIQQQALQFMSGLQQSYIQLIEDVGTGLINLLKDFASVPRVAAISGIANKTNLKEFTGGDLESINRVIVDVGNSLSQCLEKDTPILMFDGSIKMVQNIVVGDLLMGPDSEQRTVQNVNSGTEIMYEITSKDKRRSVRYGCNESHVLSLKYCSDDYRYDAQKGDILDITVKDYLKLTHREKRILQGYKVGVEFEEKHLKIPPYILGLWLGDGHSAATALTTMDSEIFSEWSNYAESEGMKIRISTNDNCGKAKIYFITSGLQNGSNDRNVVMNYLNEYNLINNKHIPNDYLVNSRKNRLELLAGLLDTDGHRIDETFIFVQKNDVLAKQVIFLCESLGFKVTSTKRYCDENFKYLKEKPTDDRKFFESNNITIGGNTWEIPCKLPRKQSKYKEKNKDWLNYGINVECKGLGTYYGFTLKEEPHFVMADFTVSHNTTAGKVQMAESLLQMGLIKEPDEYFAIINTGQMNIMTDGPNRHLMLAISENEKIVYSDEPVIALAIDNHHLHINEHQSILADPELRFDPKLVQKTLNHINEHISLLRTTDPNLLAAIGQQPLPPIGGMPVNPETMAVAQANQQGIGQGPQQMPSPDTMELPSQTGPKSPLPRPAQPARPNEGPLLPTEVPLQS